MSIDLSKLVNAKRQPDGGWQCQCPACAQNGADRNGRNHLRIYASGAFNCCVDNSLEHNRIIRAILRGYLADGERAEVVYIEPRIEMEQVYPESMLTSLIPDHSYWVKRGVKESVISLLEGGVTKADEKSKLSNRYVIPIRAPSGQINGWSGRILGDSTFAPKYKHLFRSSRACWPWHISGPHIESMRSVVLLEGWSDWLFVYQAGVKNALCLFGLNINSVIVSQLLSANVNRVIISLNRDDDPRKGQAAATKIAGRLTTFFTDVRTVFPPEGIKDWGEAAEKGDDAAFGALREALA